MSDAISVRSWATTEPDQPQGPESEEPLTPTWTDVTTRPNSPERQSPTAMSLEDLPSPPCQPPAEEETQDTLLMLWERGGAATPELDDSQDTQAENRQVPTPGPALVPSPRFGKHALLQKWTNAEVAAERYPIYFSESAGWPGHDLKSEVISAAALASAGFYVGATTDPLHRWIGSETACRGGRLMRGHARGLGGLECDEMFVIGLLPSLEAKEEEARLIRFALAECCNCLNIASDARGQIRADNFLYVVVRRL